jgi:hypothetical protein
MLRNGTEGEKNKEIKISRQTSPYRVRWIKKLKYVECFNYLGSLIT